MIRILKEAETNRGEIFAREDPVDSVEEPVRAILAQVKARGDEALKEYTKAFDGVELTSLEVGPGGRGLPQRGPPFGGDSLSGRRANRRLPPAPGPQQLFGQ